IIACDPEKIERIILNIVSNAVKFTNPGGTIFVNLIDKYDSVEIEIKDTGIGIDKKDLDNIFKRFHQVDKTLSRNSEGTGIGLTLVKSIVELHGGNITVDSLVGEGTTFRIELPARIVENSNAIEKIKPMNSKIELINIEFSDIYSI
ncbi:MAG: ATP-binding protein, partial [Clostridiaceae bacterium]